ncbi:MAG TPA: prolyl oligopeptidase family serine peptidase [Rheinheimera sp.]|nr:prolyl oligopeptidase family serine peptidase [Rheinheimera sp.]
MKYYLILLSSLLISCTSHTEQKNTTTTAVIQADQKLPPGIEALPAFSSAAELKRNFTCYGGPFESYDTWLAYDSKHPKFNAADFATLYPKAIAERRQQELDCRIFVYESDGIEVEGVMIRPLKQSAEHGKLPVVIYNRGGNALGGTLNFRTLQRFLMPIAEQGYIVIASQYRGAAAFPAGVKRQPWLDQFGGNDVNDIKNLLPIIQGMPTADSERIAMKGASRGGMMSYLAARDMPQLKALIVEAGVANLASQIPKRPDMERNIYSRFIPNYATDKDAQLSARSVLHWLDKLPSHLPILLVHGDNDWRVDVTQSQNLASALAEKGHPHKLVIYSGADHGMQPNRAEADAETAAWLKQYL